MRKSRKLWVEGLENRAMLAGNVSVSVSGGTLSIVGDNLTNGVAVEQLDNGRFFVSGFALNGANTTINGQAAGRIVSGVRHINADLNQGYDIFILSNSAFRRNELAQLLSDGTAGPVQTSPEAANPNTAHPVTARVTGDVTVKMDQGNDGVGIGARIGSRNASGGIVDGVLHVIGGDGADRVITAYTEAFDDMLFDMGSGNDSVQANAARVGDFLFANLGDGADSFTSDNAHGWHSHILGGNHDDSITVTNYHMEREVLINTGSGNDSVFARSVSGSSLAIITGDGADRVSVNGANSRGGATVDTGAGNDSVQLNGVSVANHAGVFLGSGDDVLRVGNSSASSATLNGGSGFDRFFNEGGNSFGSLNKSNFEQG